MKLTVLGCGDAFASGGRFNTSFLLDTGSRKVLLDCGASTLIRLKQEGITAFDIEGIIITHFHGDHYGGLPFLVISSVFEGKRDKPLHLFGPEGLKEKVRTLQGALYPGTEKLLDELQIHYHEFIDEGWRGAMDIEVWATKVVHAPPSNPHGVKVKIGGKVIGFSGDTEWTDSLIELASGTNLFICECNFWDKDGPGHLSYKKIQENKHLFQTKKLALTHLGTEVINQNPEGILLLEDGMGLEV